MEFRRITSLPPYVFTIIDSLKVEARRDGDDIIDLGFGNPDLPSPDIAVDKLCEAAHNKRNHRYSASRGIPKLREAIAGYYQHRFGVDIDPDTEVINTIGAKEGFSHLMWVLLEQGDAALVPSPSYPIHIFGPLFAGRQRARDPARHRRRVLRQHGRGVGVLVAQAPGDRAVVPAQPDHHLRRPRLLPAGRRLRP